MGSRSRQFARSSRSRLSPLAIVLTISVIATTIASAATGAGKIPPPSIQHVFIVIEENRGYSQVLGSSEWPYFNSLVAQGGLAGNYFATGHPSIDNYFMLTAGKSITFNDSYSKEVKVYNLARELLSVNADWKVYAENLPSPNPTSQTQDPYEKHHNPFVYFTDIVDQPDTWSHLVDFSQLAADEQADTLPQFGFIIPNAYHRGTPRIRTRAWVRTRKPMPGFSRMFPRCCRRRAFSRADCSSSRGTRATALTAVMAAAKLPRSCWGRRSSRDSSRPPTTVIPACCG